MFVPCEGAKNANFDGFTLILPAVAVGNVGQLAIDLLIYNTSMKKIGYFYDSCILPLVGNDPFTKEDEGHLVTSVEIYKSNEKKLVVVQQRAPIKKGCRQMYCNKVIEWIKECQFKQTVLLSSCLASERLDSQIQSGPFRFVVSSSAKHLTEHFQSKLGWKSLEKREDLHEKSNGGDIFLPGGGVTKKFHLTCCKKEVSLALLLVFCAEGDNIPDAMILLNYLNNWLQLLKDEKDDTATEPQRSKIHWREPPSWTNLYGTKRFSSLF